MTIYTGSRPGSGTTASICIILGGSKGETAPYCLSHQEESVFQRDSVDSFLVTSKEVYKIKNITLCKSLLVTIKLGSQLTYQTLFHNS